LAAQISDTCVTALDLRGNGCFWQERSPPGIEAMVEHCRRQLQQTRQAPPYNLFAISLGAMVATAWYQRYPHEINRMVLINTSFSTFSPFWQRLRPQQYITLLSMFLPGRDVLWREQHILRMTSHLHTHNHTIARRWCEYARQYPLSRTNVINQILAAMRYRAPRYLPAVQPLVLLLAAAGDKLVNPQCTSAIASAWQVPCVVHPCAGHDLILDAPEWVIEQVKSWLAATRAE
jgi:pimeloyl-ACP methyl ester carboxylesterase